MRKKRRRITAAIIMLAILAACAVYIGIYYHADPAAEKALLSDSKVQVTRTGYGWFFDGPSGENVFVLYPGAKVEETAYAPLCRSLAEKGMDVCLVKMPFRLAFFGTDSADKIAALDRYDRRYIGGHSLGGVFAASYAAKNSEKLDGLILLASYSTAKVNDLKTVLIYGSEDSVLNAKNYRENLKNVPADAVEYIIEGGNHAQFGSYGVQRGDGKALISAETQTEETVTAILSNTIAGNS